MLLENSEEDNKTLSSDYVAMVVVGQRGRLDLYMLI